MSELASFETCECSLEEHTADHVVSRCPLYCALDVARGLWKRNNKTTS